MDTEENKKVYISMGVTSEGDLKIITEEETLPVEVIDVLLNKIQKETLKHVSTTIDYYKKERRNWMFISFGLLLFTVYLLLKIKGVL